MARLLGLAMVTALLAAPAAAALSSLGQPAKPACAPYVDERELRFRTPAATVIGHVVPGSVREAPIDFPGVGQQLVFGTAEVIGAGRPEPQRVSYGYWLTGTGCGGWGPAQGQMLQFDLADDKAADGALRVMRYGPP